ncbi:hypothetical protein [Alienimonas chondri]|uniref:Uncharacterized protein n=1 Tax=Alienimonas chondri TaxID=2681879 RepID=A0ABX1VAS2_9PLAN|nr:hypothetical protein [Alienimonas chondri]NNJ24873.1 hypothetical protein [Alienimonas chondri]
MTPGENRSGRLFAARRVRGYLVLGPVPPLGRWWRGALRLILALMLPFWIYTPLLACWLFALDAISDETTTMSLIFAAGCVSVAAGVYPLATWPCQWPFRLAGSFVWATLMGLIAWPWTMLVASYLDY